VTAWTVPEAAAELGITPRKVAALVWLARVPVAGKRLGGRGRPPRLYRAAVLREAHAEEARRTSKGFIDNDWLGAALLGRRLIFVDVAPGEVRWPDGSRAEKVSPGGYGYVEVCGEACQAHRLVWIAAEGEIPYGIEINHQNGRPWDNRRANLELVTWEHNIRHGRGQVYSTRDQALAELAEPFEPAHRTAHGYVRAGGVWLHEGLV